MAPEELSDNADEVSREEHSGLRDGWSETFPNSIKLLSKHRRAARLDAKDARWVLGGEAGDRGRAVDTERREGVQVCLDARSASAIRTGNGEDGGNVTLRARW